MINFDDHFADNEVNIHGIESKTEQILRWADNPGFDYWDNGLITEK